MARKQQSQKPLRCTSKPTPNLGQQEAKREEDSQEKMEHMGSKPTRLHGEKSTRSK